MTPTVSETLSAAAEAAIRRLTPELREQMEMRKDGPTIWSQTHGWPAVRVALEDIGLIKALPPTVVDGWRHPTTEITPLGVEVRSALRLASTQAQGEGQ